MTGRPVITSACSSMPEVAGDGAILVDPKQVSEIRRAIKRVMSEPGLRQELIARGTRNVARYSAAAIAKLYLELYEEVERGSAPDSTPSAS
jgi:glycosyltransferase involved in cell wall biosynthesis